MRITEAAVVYPESDGQPMADNTTQFEWIVTIKENLDALFAGREDVFVAGDLLWYPVEGHPEIRAAPDAMVAFGRPKGHRGSYIQFREGSVAPQVVFEVASPGNTILDWVRRFQFYAQYGVDEYYIYDPDKGELTGWQRQGGPLTEIPQMHGWVSPRLGVRFEIENGEMRLYGPDGERFLTFGELAERAKQERQRAEQERQRADRLAERLRELGQDPDAL